MNRAKKRVEICMLKGNPIDGVNLNFVGSAKSPGHSGSEGGLNRSICNVDPFLSSFNIIIVTSMLPRWSMEPRAMSSIWPKEAK